jgi:hypothetical protein
MKKESNTWWQLAPFAKKKKSRIGLANANTNNVEKSSHVKNGVGDGWGKW